MSIQLTVLSRDTFGKKTSALRRQGFIPAELYGHGLKNVHLAVAQKDFQRTFVQAGENALVELTVGGAKHAVMICDVSRDPVSDEVMSVDFYQERLDERVKVKVPVHFAGEAPAVKEL